MTSLRLRLALSYLAVLLIGAAVAAPLAALAIEQQHLDAQRANLLAQAQLVAATLPDEVAAPAPGTLNQAANLLPGIHTRVLDSSGAPLLDAPAPRGAASGAAGSALVPGEPAPVSAAELLARPEVAGALAGRPSTMVRTVGGAGRVLYAAAPVVRGDGQVRRIVYIASPLPGAGQAALPATLRWQLAGALAAAGVCAGLAGWWLAARLTRPLETLADAARAVAGGDLQRTVAEDRTAGELLALGQAFNQMTGELRRSEQARAAFIADVGHELRTPLTVIKGTVETLRDGALDDLAVREGFLASLASETDRLIRLVNDLLVLTRADLGALDLRPEPLRLDELAAGRVRQFARLAEQAGICLGARADAAAWALADAQRVTQVLDNLLDNALRHTPRGGAVTVSVAVEGDEVRCAVADSGCGIEAAQLPLIFDRFYRADRARSRRDGGSGLGLAISRALVDAHGGRIAAESAPGAGTTLAFWLPAAPG